MSDSIDGISAHPLVISAIVAFLLHSAGPPAGVPSC